MRLQLEHSIHHPRCEKCQRVVRTTLRWLLGGIITHDEAIHRIANYHQGCEQGKAYAEAFAASTNKLTRIAWSQQRW